jgi:hypothetical protein
VVPIRDGEGQRAFGRWEIAPFVFGLIVNEYGNDGMEGSLKIIGEDREVVSTLIETGGVVALGEAVFII